MSYTPGPLPIPDRSMWQYGVKTDHYTAEQLSAHTAAEVARAVAAERERCAKLSIKIGNRKDEDCPSACTGLWPAQIGFAISEAIRADPQRLQDKGE